MLSFIGIGGAFAIDLNNCSAFIKNENHLILIDCGENIFEKIIKLNLLSEINSITIIITHFHSDHIGSLGSLLFYLDKLNIRNTNIIYPNKEKMENLLKLFGVEKCNYNILQPNEYKKIRIKEFKQSHSFMEAYGYLIEINNQTIYFSGDTKIIPNQVLELFFNDKIDYFYQDIRKELNDYHISIEEIEKIVPYEKRKNIQCMHFNSEEEMNYIKEKGFTLVKKID